MQPDASTKSMIGDTLQYNFLALISMYLNFFQVQNIMSLDIFTTHTCRIITLVNAVHKVC